MSDYKVQQHFKHYISRLNSALKSIDNAELKKLVDVVQDSSSCNNTIFIAGNGGSAPTASHWSTDISKGVYYRSGKSIRTISLTDNVAWITAVANDIGYESIFCDQLRSHGKSGDILIVISASGNSRNIIKLLETAKRMSIFTISIVGFDGGEAKLVSDMYIHIKTTIGDYGVAEDVQLILNHFLCDYISEGCHDNN